MSNELIEQIIAECRRSNRRARDVIETWRADGLLAADDHDCDVLEAQCIVQQAESKR